MSHLNRETKRYRSNEYYSKIKMTKHFKAIWCDIPVLIKKLNVSKGRVYTSSKLDLQNDYVKLRNEKPLDRM